MPWLLLDSRASALRRDECGDWGINGLDGHIYAVPEGFQFVVFKQGPRGWNVAKYRLAFCAVTQDGDTEGAFILDRLPSRAEAKIIRVVLRIPKRRHLSEAQREIATERLARARLNAQNPRRRFRRKNVPSRQFSAVLTGDRHERAVDGGRMPIFKRPHRGAGRSR